ncbi:putative MFS family arabinose efflux permease [Cupriavidus plantarum]|uniref:Putative MFS family arabinose efflux permease n=2 Tax=Cupriavidus plantarum TaxID=942865 RepID=A0A316F1A2_9BURK|nr:putative MFS family arabinose efflux permease [Cupriavidus plantarum]
MPMNESSQLAQLAPARDIGAVSASPRAVEEPGRPALFRAYMTLSILILAYIISLVDRQVMALMVGPIKQSLQIDDVQIGLLQGFSFALFYCILGLPLGRVADKSSRRVLIAAGMAFWSAATVACAFAETFGELFLARMCVGIGEAALAPAAYSLLADLFPGKRLVRANALFSMGAMLGGSLALLVGGTALDYASKFAGHALGGQFSAWQLVFIAVGLPGILLTVVLLAAVREPKRLDDSPLPTVREAYGQIWALRRHLTPLYTCAALLSIVMFANLGWLPSHFIRTYHMTPSATGQGLGIALVLGSVAGTFLGPTLTNWLLRKGYADAHMRTVLIASVLILAPLFGPMLETPRGALVAAFFYFLVQNSYFGAITASAQMVTPNRVRAINSGILFLLMNLIGLGGASVVVAWVSVHVFGGQANAIGHAIILVCTLASLASATVAAATLKRYRAAPLTVVQGASR